jgi:hypothetical protein
MSSLTSSKRYTTHPTLKTRVSVFEYLPTPSQILEEHRAQGQEDQALEKRVEGKKAAAKKKAAKARKCACFFFYYHLSSPSHTTNQFTFAFFLTQQLAQRKLPPPPPLYQLTMTCTASDDACMIVLPVRGRRRRCRLSYFINLISSRIVFIPLVLYVAPVTCIQ